mmetsp:Transcript_16102/g.27446  ORF Transcript_16102/g.27446 Transcript_16102/m.27446 type:complete len:280 (-) Transcript_16102:146-985(-)
MFPNTVALIPASASLTMSQEQEIHLLYITPTLFPPRDDPSPPLPTSPPHQISTAVPPDHTSNTPPSHEPKSAWRAPPYKIPELPTVPRSQSSSLHPPMATPPMPTFPSTPNTNYFPNCTHPSIHRGAHRHSLPARVNFHRRGHRCPNDNIPPWQHCTIRIRRDCNRQFSVRHRCRERIVPLGHRNGRWVRRDDRGARRGIWPFRVRWIIFLRGRCNRSMDIPPPPPPLLLHCSSPLTIPCHYSPTPHSSSSRFLPLVVVVASFLFSLLFYATISESIPS